MTYSKKQLEQYSEETGFLKHYIEKVIRLLDVLDYLFNKSDFKDKVILKGGTAINLAFTNLKRLSVDIDLDYVGSLDKDETLKDRKILEDELDKYMASEKYEISSKSRSSFALFSRIYKYQNAFGNNDTIKVDINFMDRTHLYATVLSEVTYFDKTVVIRTPAIEELFGMKINALIDRSKPRDLYDSLFIVENINRFDVDMLRKSVVFYLSLNNTFKIDNSSFERIKTISQQSIKTELQPVLKKSVKFDLKEAQEKVIDCLSNLLSLDRKESLYLEEFSKGNYDPSLLFDDSVVIRAEKHPMAKWRALNITK